MARRAKGAAVLLILAGTLANPPTASGQEPLTLDAAVRSALTTHPSLGVARARLDVAEADAGAARSARLPTLGTRAVATHYQEPMVVAPLHGFDPSDPPAFERTLLQAHAVAEWTAFDGGARSARIRGAEALSAAAEAGVAATRESVIAEAVSSYLAALTAGAVEAAHEELVGALEAERSRSALLFEQGRTARVQLLRTEAALSRARADLEAARATRALALRRLGRAAGLEPGRVEGAVLEPVGALSGALPARGDLVRQALASHPELERARRRAAASETLVAAARSSYQPRIGLAARYSAFGSAGTDPRPEWNAGVEVSWPVFTGGARGRAVERAAAESSAARAEAALVARRVEDAVDGALAAYHSARARAAALEAAVSQSAEVARIEGLALEAGAGVQAEYLRAAAELLETRAALAEARHAVVDARVRLARATGVLTTEWLSAMTREEGTR